jgi:3-oxoacyl-[acyl-carrier-protein] synthase-1
MQPRPISIAATGMVTGVGLNAPASCAAIRAGIQNATETHFMFGSEGPLMGVQVPLQRLWRGRAKLLRMLIPAITECLDQAPQASQGPLPLMLCVAEKERAGRLEGLDDELFHELTRQLAFDLSQQDSRVVPLGRPGVTAALREARELLYDRGFPWVLVAGADSLLVAETLETLESEGRLLTSDNSNGFIPGEAAAAVLLARADSAPASALCVGIGLAMEAATISTDKPLRADGLVGAVRNSLHEAQCAFSQLDFRIADVSGEHYYFKEAALLQSRLMRDPHVHGKSGEFPLWHPADCIGEVGAAFGPVALGVAAAAFSKRYSPGSLLLVHMSADSGSRGALVIQGAGADA